MRCSEGNRNDSWPREHGGRTLEQLLVRAIDALGMDKLLFELAVLDCAWASWVLAIGDMADCRFLLASAGLLLRMRRRQWRGIESPAAQLV
jgi:hypothetical protein